jgi:hypothetical protein
LCFWTRDMWSCDFKHVGGKRVPSKPKWWGCLRDVIAVANYSWRAPKSRGETHLKVSQSQVAKSWDSEARSRLPTLERGRGSSWEPRD